MGRPTRCRHGRGDAWPPPRQQCCHAPTVPAAAPHPPCVHAGGRGCRDPEAAGDQAVPGRQAEGACATAAHVLLAAPRGARLPGTAASRPRMQLRRAVHCPGRPCSAIASLDRTAEPCHWPRLPPVRNNRSTRSRPARCRRRARRRSAPPWCVPGRVGLRTAAGCQQVAWQRWPFLSWAASWLCGTAAARLESRGALLKHRPAFVIFLCAAAQRVRTGRGSAAFDVRRQSGLPGARASPPNRHLNCLGPCRRPTCWSAACSTSRPLRSMVPSPASTTMALPAVRLSRTSRRRGASTSCWRRTCWRCGWRLWRQQALVDWLWHSALDGGQIKWWRCSRGSAACRRGSGSRSNARAATRLLHFGQQLSRWCLGVLTLAPHAACWPPVGVAATYVSPGRVPRCDP
jgi:hypothetical protein